MRWKLDLDPNPVTRLRHDPRQPACSCHREDADHTPGGRHDECHDITRPAMQTDQTTTEIKVT